MNDNEWVIGFSTEFLKQAEIAYDKDFYDWMGHSCEYSMALVEWLDENICRVPEDRRTWCIFTLGGHAENYYWDRRKKDPRDPDMWLPAGYHGSAHTCIIEGRDPADCKICKKQEANSVPKPGKQIARRKPKLGDKVRILPFLFKLKAFWNGWYPRPEHYIGRIGVIVSGDQAEYEKVSDEDFMSGYDKEDERWCSYEDWFTRSVAAKVIPEIDITLDKTDCVCVHFERKDNRFVPDDYDHVYWDNLPHTYKLDQVEVIDGKRRSC
jgi:hypothetical protein